MMKIETEHTEGSVKLIDQSDLPGLFTRKTSGELTLICRPDVSQMYSTLFVSMKDGQTTEIQKTQRLSLEYINQYFSKAPKGTKVTLTAE